jgi:hypothetical protein
MTEANLNPRLEESIFVVWLANFDSKWIFFWHFRKVCSTAFYSLRAPGSEYPSNPFWMVTALRIAGHCLAFRTELNNLSPGRSFPFADHRQAICPLDFCNAAMLLSMELDPSSTSRVIPISSKLIEKYGCLVCINGRDLWACYTISSNQITSTEMKSTTWQDIRKVLRFSVRLSLWQFEIPRCLIGDVTASESEVVQLKHS